MAQRAVAVTLVGLATGVALTAIFRYLLAPSQRAPSSPSSSSSPSSCSPPLASSSSEPADDKQRPKTTVVVEDIDGAVEVDGAHEDQVDMSLDLDELDEQIEAAMANAAASAGSLDEIVEEDMPAWMRCVEEERKRKNIQRFLDTLFSSDPTLKVGDQ
jgi:hypothetical protein